MDTRRQRKLESSIKQTIMRAITLGEIKDPRVTSEIIITEVNLSRDLSQAKIYVSSYLSKSETVKACEGLNSASGVMRTILGHVLRTKNTPKPIFILDERIKEGFYLGQKIINANREAGISEQDINIQELPEHDK